MRWHVNSDRVYIICIEFKRISPFTSGRQDLAKTDEHLNPMEVVFVEAADMNYD